MIDILTVIGGIIVIAMIVALEYLLVFFLSVKNDLDRQKNIITVSVYTRKEFQLKAKQENLSLQKALELKKFYEREEDAIVIITITGKGNLRKKREEKENV